ncbi:PASTA domain-containing protein [Mycolicibacterium grossiae]|uniref:PASTA domain-containing protein n=1 Tax=Mycolicibacterium grossiae TaxID=1552759 RepID=A0A1E8PWL3_9MYCO|nr:PASTA domain-containing protein [Mycolicibacterium grossiae]OFJ50487.1 hypothetical protein BEL07_27965 [Mycolicibacterium grossiae]QEM43572.1 PASTA domain-containing protein [Mycolicibacterium grossiae]
METSGPITEATWSDGKWPLLVSEGVIKCCLEDSMVTFTAGSVEYGLNQTAIRFGGYPDIQEIVADKRLTGYVEMRRRSLRFAATIVASLLLIGCGGQSNNAASPTRPTPATSATEFPRSTSPTAFVPEVLVMPDVTGLTFNDFRQLMTSFGWVGEIVKLLDASDGDTPPETILRQEPPPGSPIGTSTPVTVQVRSPSPP